MKGWIAGTLLATLAAVAVGAVAIAQEDPPDPTPEPVTETTANVEVRVWQDVNNARNIYISARPEGGNWATLGTIPLPLDDGHSSNGRFRYGDIVVAVPVGSGESDVEVRVWQAVRDALSVYISARPEGGSWATLGTIPLPLDDGHSSSGRFRYGDITVEVPVPLPWVDPRPADTYTLAQLAAMPAPRAPQAPPKPEHVMALEIVLWSESVRTYLVNASRVSVLLSQTYNSRNYSVTCAPVETWHSNLSCEYSADAPLNSSGTMRIPFDGYDGKTAFVSASLDGDQLVCEERPRSEWPSDYPIWWCYDPTTWRAWEAARDRALAPPDDPLERYLRQQGGPPLWYDDSPFEGVGDYTTGVFRMAAYVDYEARVEHRTNVQQITLQCVSDSTDSTEYRVIGELSESRLRWWEADGFSAPVYARGAMLCELAIRADGEWSVNFAPVNDDP